MSITRDEVIAALDVAQKLRGLGYSVMIAGGFCRDVYFGEMPKDLDIVVAAGPGTSANHSDIHETLAGALSDIDVVHLGFRMYTESASDRLIGGFKCAGNLDVVLYDVRTAPEAVEAFDFNLNQFMPRGVPGVDHIGRVEVIVVHQNELVEVRSDFSEARKGKMKEKFLNLTWRFPEGEGPARVPLNTAVLPEYDI